MNSKKHASKISRRKDCRRCGQTFSKAEHLKRHERSHTGERPFTCTLCGKSYARSDVLARHIKGHRRPTSTEGPIDSTVPLNGSAPEDSVEEQIEVISGDHTPAVAECLQGGRRLNLPNVLAMEPDKRAQRNQREDISIRSYHVATPAQQELPGTEPATHCPQSHLPPSNMSHIIWPQPSERPASLDLPEIPTSLAMFGAHPALDELDLSSLFQMEDFLQPRSSFEGKISSERLERIQRVWPSRRPHRSLAPALIQWQDIVSYGEDNLFSMATVRNSTVLPGGEERLESTWDFNAACRDRLSRDCRHYCQRTDHSSTRDRASTNEGFTPSTGSESTKDLPPTDILDMSLDLFFYHFYPLLPLIQPSTFSAPSTPSSLLFPMCLIGLSRFNRRMGLSYARSYVPGAIIQCRAELASHVLRQCGAPQFLTAMASACLLLFVAMMVPELASDETVQSLCEETVCLACERGLFSSSGYDCEPMLRNLVDDQETWKAFCRVESAKRVIVSLALVDGYCSQVFNVAPTISANKVQLPIPCTDDLFRSQSANEWRAIFGSSPKTALTWQPKASNDIPSGLSGYAMYAVLSGFWLRILEAQHRLLNSQQEAVEQPGHILIPSQVFALDEEARSIAPGLARMIDIYGHELPSANVNIMTLWHFNCLAVTTNLGIIESAAGRSGPVAANEGINALMQWADSSAARRACLHASQILVLMSNRKSSDGIMLHSEIAVFFAALVLGLYFMAAPEGANLDEPALDLLVEIDWTLVGDEGLVTHSLSAEQTCSSPAAHFIRHGRPLCFSGVTYKTPYAAARRVFMNFATLLEDAGKWNVDRYCDILRIISDTLMESDGISH